MKRFYSIIAGLLLTTMAINAQDASNWQPGDDVTEQLEWMDYTGESNNGAWQKSEGAGVGYDFQCWEMFNNPTGAETYQIFWLPAGVYTFKVQGFYRGGYNPNYWKKNEEINAVFFAESVTLDEETGEVAEVTRSASVEMLSIASTEYSQGRIFSADDWQTDTEYNYDGTNYYVPNSMHGTREWFNLGYYDDNNLKVVQVEDGYIKIGMRKTAEVAYDWLIWSNFRAVYESDAGAAVQLILAEEEFNNALDKADELENTFNVYPALNGYYQIAKEEVYEKYDDLGTIEGYTEGVVAIQELINKFKGYYNDANTLKTLVTLSEKTLNATDYPGKAELQAAIATANTVLADGEDEDMNKWATKSAEDYSAALNTLATARANYAISQGKAEDGTYDFLTIIAYPFFCQPEYNPVWSEENNRWESIDLVLNGDGELKGWADLRESGDGEDKTYVTTTRVRIGDGLAIGTNKESVYEWYQVNTTGYEPYWNHGLPSAKQWALVGNEREIAQNLVALPNGYYSLKGCGMTWGNDWASDGGPNDAHLGIRIQAGDNIVESAETVKKSGWWGNDYNDWTYFTTGMVQVTDGKLRVSFFANGFSSFTGMQLVYYGEQPDFSKMIAARIAAINAKAEEELTLTGDRTAVAAILAEIPAEVNSFDLYDAALKSLADAENYMAAATAFLNSNDVTEMFINKQATYEDGTDEFEILQQGVNETLNAYDADATTYKDIQSLVADYNAYVHYLDVVADYKNGQFAAAVADLLAEQTSQLKSAFAHAATLESYEKALAKPYNEALLASLGVDKASEKNPVDVTVLITNPSFTEGRKGWDGSLTVDGGLQLAENYDSDSFDISQTLYSLPAGAYEVRVKAYYRDGSATDAYNHIWIDDDYQANVQLYANQDAATVVSIANENALFTERSYTEYTFTVANPEEGEADVVLRAWVEEDQEEDVETGEITYNVTSWREALLEDMSKTEETADDAWIYDSWVSEGDTRYFYPNSMRGGNARFQNDNGAYTNIVQTMVGEEGTLKFGLRKFAHVSYDWCLFDDFQLFYLGTDVPSGINTVKSAGTARQIFAVDGRRLNTLQRGINIVKMADGSVKKVIVK